MAYRMVRQLARLLFAAALASGSLTSAQACLWTGGWLDPDKPFEAVYLDEGQIIFRGRPVKIHIPKHNTKTANANGPEANFENGFEITFDVLATYRGEVKETWTAYRIGSVFKEPLDLEVFKREVGDDLLVVLSEPDDSSRRFTQFPLIALGECGELAMRRFIVMEPVLRERELIH